MRIEIKNVRNVKRFCQSFKENTINFIYGPNGVGKSSIIKALTLSNEDLLKQRSYFDWGNPEVIVEEINEDYEVNLFDENHFNITFVENQLSNNTYDLIFKTSDIIMIEKQITDNVKELKRIIETDDFKDLESQVNEFVKMLVGTKENELKKTNTYKSLEKYKSIKKGDVIENYYLIYNHINNKVEWLNWINNTKPDFFYEKRCPYCSSEMTSNIEESLNYIKNNVKGKDLNNIIKLDDLLDKIERNIAINHDSIRNITSGKGRISAQTNSKKILREAKNVKEIQDFINQLKNIVNSDLTYNYKQINIDKFSLNKNSDIYKELENSLWVYNKNIRKLNGLNKTIQNKLLNRVEKYNELIDEFLKSSGINYKIEFKQSTNQPIIISLKFIGNKQHIYIDNLSNHLSFGEEKIITALFFLLYKSSSKQTIYLFDDPITLFDETKRFAFLSLLNSIKFNKDLKPKIIKPKDYIIVFSHSFSAFKENITIKNSTNFIAFNTDGVLELKKVNSKDLVSYYEKITAMIFDTSNELTRLILYRNLIQTSYFLDPSNRKYNYISSLAKLAPPNIKDGTSPFSKEKNADILEKINTDELFGKKMEINRDKFIERLDIYNIVDSIINTKLGYEKIILFRVAIDFLNNNKIIFIKDDKIIRRFITSLFHVENDQLFSLSTIETVPKYILDLVDNIAKNIKKDITAISIKQNDFDLIL